MPKHPFFRQIDSMDCGPTCLKMIASYYGRSYTMQTIRQKCLASKEGVSLLGLSEAAESLGFHTSGVSIRYDHLIKEVPFPCIAHWKNSHFVVIYQIKKKRSFFRGNKQSDIIKVADPSHGIITYTKEEFLSCWSTDKDKTKGICLLFETTPRFYNESPDSKQIIDFKYLINLIRPYKKLITQLLLASITGSLISLAFPFLTQSIVDFGINNSNLAFITMVLVAQMVLSLGQTANGLIRSWIMLHMTTRVGISLISSFLAKLMKLPISFFDVKLIGDIIQRIGDHSRIQRFITGTLLTSLFSVITLIMYTFVMAGYHMGILGIFYLGSTIYISWITLFLKRRRELDFKRFQQLSSNQSNIVQLISGMQEIKLNNCEKQKRWSWERIQAKLFKISIKSLVLEQNQQIGSSFIDQAKNILISFISAKAVVEGSMTIGMMMAIQYIIGQLNGPIQQFIGFTREAQDARISLERLGEIHSMDDEEIPGEEKIQNIPHDIKFFIRNVTFQYDGPNSNRVLNNLSLEIQAKKVTAIVGVSGSGKTTLLKLLLGFYVPVKGEILINNIPSNHYSPTALRRQCGVVMQEGFLFSDTISNNICLIDDRPDEEKLNHAATTANILEFVEGLPLGFKTIIGNEGHGLSSGQKQRILIARAVYKEPSFMIFDEATNALDASNEGIIMDKLSEFFKGRTVLIVAHRLSTVKKADHIVVMDKGRIIEKGTHSELVKIKGTYYNLVKDQLSLGA